jgi:hypothetical protein
MLSNLAFIERVGGGGSERERERERERTREWGEINYTALFFGKLALHFPFLL